MVEPAADQEPPKLPWGISLSGGGIRSASFCLGVLQVMRPQAMLAGPQGAKRITSVSGGSYMASAMAIVDHGAFEVDEEPSKVLAGDVKLLRDYLRHRANEAGYLAAAGGALRDPASRFEEEQKTRAAMLTELSRRPRVWRLAVRLGSHRDDRAEKAGKIVTDIDTAGQEARKEAERLGISTTSNPAVKDAWKKAEAEARAADDAWKARQPVTPTSDLPAFAPGTPEERYLRDHTRYLTHGWGGPVAVVWRLLLSIMLNFGLFVLIVMAIGFPVGWLYGWHLPSLRRTCPPAARSAGQCLPHHLSFPALCSIVPVVLVTLGVLVGLLWVMGVVRGMKSRRNMLIVSLGALGLAGLWALAVFVVPIALEWLRSSVGAKGHHQTPPAGHAATATAAATGGGALVSVLTALFGARTARTIEAQWDRVPRGIQSSATTRAKNLFLKLRAPLVNLLITLVGPATAVAILFLGLELGGLFTVGTTAGGLAWPLGAEGGAILLLLLGWVFANLTEWSLHPFYRERLSAAFCLRRFKAPSQKTVEPWDGTTVRVGNEYFAADRRRFRNPPRISETQLSNRPELVLCAAANVSNYGATPTGFKSTSFVFSAGKVGGDLVGEVTAKDYENVLSRLPALKSICSLPAAVAMSGAALSPEMGRVTRAPLRFLLTLANVRLGVWLPNPRYLDWFANCARPSNGRRRASEQRTTPREAARTAPWAPNRPHPVLALYCRFPRLVKPRVNHLLYEAIGKNKLEKKFLYVTDGGHYENLGLVEQLREGSLYVFTLDASGDQQDSFTTIASAVGLAFSELNIRIDIEPEKMAPDPDLTEQRAQQKLPPVVQSTFCVGNIYYPVGNQYYPKGCVGRLVVIKAGVPRDAPQDVTAFHNQNWRFPCDPTTDQLYTADRFDAYKSLGAFAGVQAIDYVKDDFERFRATGVVKPWRGHRPFGPPMEEAVWP